MNRKYTTAQFKGIVYGLREAFDDVAITTDIMVGFPDESDEEFNKTVEFVRNINLPTPMFSNIRNVAEHQPQNVQTKFHRT